MARGAEERVRVWIDPALHPPVFTARPSAEKATNLEVGALAFLVPAHNVAAYGKTDLGFRRSGIVAAL